MSFFKDVRKGMERFGKDISTLVNTVILSVVYIISVGITSLVARMAGKRFLDMKLDKKAKSYWSNLNARKRSMDQYYRQF
jgi:hypothetical protein